MSFKYTTYNCVSIIVVKLVKLLDCMKMKVVLMICLHTASVTLYYKIVLQQHRSIHLKQGLQVSFYYARVF